MQDDLQAQKTKENAISNPVGVKGLPQITSLSQLEDKNPIFK